MTQESRGWGPGAWLLGLAGVLVLLAAVWRVLPMLDSSSGAIGDGVEVASYGFDLGNALVPPERIVASGFPRDGVPALSNPALMPGREVEEFSRSRRGKYIVPDDRVVGVAFGGEARAYPLRVLNWHEVLNDVVGGVPLAVTFHPLCDSVVVFDRRVAQRTIEFGVSGLLYNSNLLMYDRGAGADEAPSLWSQLQARAIAGPAADRGDELKILPASIMRWRDWLERHPETTVPAVELDRLRKYQRNPCGNYLTTGTLRFPVDPLPPAEGPALMERVVVFEDAAGSRRVVPLGEFEGTRQLAPGLALRAEAEPPPSILAEESSASRPLLTLWFAWFATHPDSALDGLQSTQGQTGSSIAWAKQGAPAAARAAPAESVP
ncbi:MAG: DUF3179 domain-containing protein [bacterium]|nr:DUF3179 domain-containing protein [bacterium]